MVHPIHHTSWLGSNTCSELPPQGNKTKGWEGPKCCLDVESGQMKHEQFYMNTLRIQIWFITFFVKISITIKPEQIFNTQEFTTDLWDTNSCGLHFEMKKIIRMWTKWLAHCQQDAKKPPNPSPDEALWCLSLKKNTWELWTPTKPVDFRFHPGVRAFGICQVC